MNKHFTNINMRKIQQRQKKQKKYRKKARKMLAVLWYSHILGGQRKMYPSKTPSIRVHSHKYLTNIHEWIRNLFHQLPSLSLWNSKCVHHSSSRRIPFTSSLLLFFFCSPFCSTIYIIIYNQLAIQFLTRNCHKGWWVIHLFQRVSTNH